MGLLEFPNPVSWLEGAKNAGLERKELDAFVSSTYSAWLSFLWSLGAKGWWGAGQAMRDAATASYLTLSLMESKNFLTLTVPKDLLAADNLARFQSEERKK